MVSATMKLFLLTLFALFSIISTNVDYWRDEPRVGVMARDNHHTIDSEKKNVKCPLGYIRCDGECVWNWVDVSRPGQPASLRHCGEKCISNDGKCEDGYFPCRRDGMDCLSNYYINLTNLDKYCD